MRMLRLKWIQLGKPWFFAWVVFIFKFCLGFFSVLVLFTCLCVVLLGFFVVLGFFNSFCCCCGVFFVLLLLVFSCFSSFWIRGVLAVNMGVQSIWHDEMQDSVLGSVSWQPRGGAKAWQHSPFCWRISAAPWILAASKMLLAKSVTLLCLLQSVRRKSGEETKLGDTKALCWTKALFLLSI